MEEHVLLLWNLIPTWSQHTSQISVEEQEIKVVLISGFSISFQSGKTEYVIFHT